MMKKCWLATNDARTRDWHAELNGKAADNDEYFVNSIGRILYPGDPSAHPANVYNCRCTLTYKVMGFRKADGTVVPVKGAHVNDFTVTTYAKDVDKSGGSDIIKETEYDYFEAFTIENKFTEAQAKTLDEAVLVIPEKHRTAIENHINGVNIVEGRGYCSYNPATKELTIDPDIADKSIVHEYGHALADAYKIYDDEKFLSILADGLDISDWGNITPYPDPYIDGEFVNILPSSKFVIPYQGRVYGKIIDYDLSRPVPLKCFQEYFSVGFDTYFANPVELKNKDPQLYNYIKELMENG